MDIRDWESDELIAREFTAQFPQCPKPALVQAARAGVLPDELRDRLDRHVAHCAACTALAADLSELDQAPLQPGDHQRIWGQIRSGIAEQDAPQRRKVATWWRVLVAAALVVASIGAWSALHNRAPEVAIVQPPPPPVAPTPTVFVMQKPPVMLPAPAVLVWRGAADAANGPVEALRSALIPYEAGHYAEAVDALTPLTAKYPKLAEAHFYLGVSLLLLDRNSDAAAPLKVAQGLAPATLSDAVAWYLALAYHRDGHDADARPLLQTVCSSAGKYSAEACSGLKELPAIQ